MTQYTFNKIMKLKLPLWWYVGIVTKKSEKVLTFDNKDEAIDCYQIYVSTQPEIVFVTEFRMNKRGTSYNQKDIRMYRSPENKKHIEELDRKSGKTSKKSKKSKRGGFWDFME